MGAAAPSRPNPGWRNIKPATKGEVRNPQGINGWTKARARAAEVIAEHADDLLGAALELANEKDVNALRLLLGPVLNIKQHEHSGPDGGPINFSQIARLAKEDT